MILSDRLRRYSKKCLTERLDPDFADAVEEAADALENMPEPEHVGSTPEIMGYEK